MSVGLVRDVLTDFTIIPWNSWGKEKGLHLIVRYSTVEEHGSDIISLSVHHFCFTRIAVHGYFCFIRASTGTRDFSHLLQKHNSPLSSVVKHVCCVNNPFCCLLAKKSGHHATLPHLPHFLFGHRLPFETSAAAATFSLGLVCGNHYLLIWA